jgi:hypothetical protein
MDANCIDLSSAKYVVEAGEALNDALFLHVEELLPGCL